MKFQVETGRFHQLAPAMIAFGSAELTVELEAAVSDGSPARRARMLRQVADLFLAEAHRLNPSQLCIFDEVLVRLLHRTEARALAELGAALADATPPLPETMRRLAYHDNPAVASPALLKSRTLQDADLVEIAGNRSQQHLLAISKRPGLSEAVTEAVLKHAGKDVSRVLARNASAKLTEKGYASLLATAAHDDTVAEALGLRADLPEAALENLLAKTTETVRSRLRKCASPPTRERVQAALDRAAMQDVPNKPAPDDYAEAHAAVIALNHGGKLNDSSVNRFAIRREYPNVIAALSLLSGGSVDVIAPLMDEDSGAGLLIACRASRLNWQTTLAVINNRRVPPLSKQQLDQAREVFEMLYVSSAQYTIRFEPPQTTAKKLISDDHVIAAGERR
ncbi:MAG: DUF2336 domain-containing protein [Bradyrhizobium sp.]|nr:DUF2336 domain-containing protein [Bradyrhizobium sp.]